MGENFKMIDYRAIYRGQGELYDRLVNREDYMGNLLPALLDIHPIEGVKVVDLGAGSGRVTRMLSPRAKHIVAIDTSAHMLDIANSRLVETGAHRYSLSVADYRRIPLKDDSVDISIAGWSIGHCISWYDKQWRQLVRMVIEESERVVRPGGAIIILETLGTGRSSPVPPSPGLKRYYDLLENEWDFYKTWIRTDYAFLSLSEAITLSKFFFGDELAERVKREELTILPECTGIWWKRK
jgi:ubiquinone/menaquinone biosynthesis C-methylase UbiE